jgi:hypothetical protein
VIGRAPARSQLYDGSVRKTIEIDCSSDAPPAGASVIVQVRDTSLADAAATIVAEARTTTTATGGRLADVELELPDDDLEGKTVWVLVDVDGDGGVSLGDYITKQSFPLRGAGERMRVTVSRVG